MMSRRLSIATLRVALLGALALATIGASQAHAACVASDTRLCLLNGRFSATLRWNDGTGFKNAYVAGPKTDGASSAAGLFYFYASDSSNWEILTKMIDGCGSNNHFWLLTAASTGFGWELVVKDEANGTTKTFAHPLNGQASGIADFEAFATCGSTPPPTPTPAPTGELASLIGTWKFTYTIISTFTDTFRLRELDNSGTYPVLYGLDQFNYEVGVIRIRDVSPSSTLPYTFFLLNPGVIICENFLFNRTSTTNVQGIYFQTYPDSSGICGSTFLNTFNMTGLRTSTSSLLVGSAPSMSIESLKAARQSESEGAVANSAIIDSGMSAEIAALLQKAAR